MSFKTGEFNPSDLIVIEPTGREVILVSGSPVLQVEAVESGQDGKLRAIVSWWEDGQMKRDMFPLACLRKLSKITDPAEVGFPAESEP